MSKRYSLTGSILVLTLFMVPAAAWAVPLSPNQVLQAKFKFPGDPTSPIGEIDLLDMILNASCAGICGAPKARFELFDGATLLGSYTQTFAQPFTSFAFTSPTSLYTFSATSVSDFTSVANGTINGKLDIVNLSPQTFDFSVSVPAGAVGRAFQANAYTSGSPQPILISQELAPVPAPSSVLLIMGGLPLLVRRSTV